MALSNRTLESAESAASGNAVPDSLDVSGDFSSSSCVAAGAPWAPSSDEAGQADPPPKAGSGSSLLEPSSSRPSPTSPASASGTLPIAVPSTVPSAIPTPKLPTPKLLRGFLFNFTVRRITSRLHFQPLALVIPGRFKLIPLWSDHTEHIRHAFVCTPGRTGDFFLQGRFSITGAQLAGYVSSRLSTNLSQLSIEAVARVLARTPVVHRSRQGTRGPSDVRAKWFHVGGTPSQPNQLPLRVYLVGCSSKPGCVVLLGHGHYGIGNGRDRLTGNRQPMTPAELLGTIRVKKRDYIVMKLVENTHVITQLLQALRSRRVSSNCRGTVGDHRARLRPLLNDVANVSVGRYFS